MSKFTGIFSSTPYNHLRVIIPILYKRKVEPQPKSPYLSKAIHSFTTISEAYHINGAEQPIHLLLLTKI